MAYHDLPEGSQAFIVHFVVEASRSHALGMVTSMSVGIGSTLLDQFQTSYFPRVFNLTLP